MDWTLSNIASSVGGIFILIYLIVEVVQKAGDNIGWFKNTRTKRNKARQEKQAKETRDIVMECIKPIEQKLDCIIESNNDLLRQEILNIYYKYLKYQKLPHHAAEQLEKLYKDYTNQGGNSFVHSLYTVMQDWLVVSSDEELK